MKDSHQLTKRRQPPAAGKSSSKNTVSNHAEALDALRAWTTARLQITALTKQHQNSTKKAARGANKAAAKKDAARDKKHSQTVKANASKDAARKKAFKKEKAGRAGAKKNNK